MENNFIIAVCSGCDGYFVCDEHNDDIFVEGVDLVNNTAQYGCACMNCLAAICTDEIWHDANGDYQYNHIYHEDIQGK